MLVSITPQLDHICQVFLFSVYIPYILSYIMVLLSFGDHHVISTDISENNSMEVTCNINYLNA